ncbi:G-type lectin S-receptor-like serine/threonine-protein kinase [Quillaja saponaria]|uniref:Receptor-like serine/threonine-protein kinase n=1 Tax=Quillaja saponaria TaxID=32244 RepID=A0AAD7M1Y4_QUISA|nr:G-type lectin S-receptor-like serine/threonine-protein kinase [Quillaja saponaria]
MWFKLGFFSPENSTGRYVGIWYLSESAVIWIANRNNPLRDSSGIITISEDGNLVVINGQKEVFWTSNVSNTEGNSRAQLLDSGNLVLQGNTTGTIVWESFKNPSDAIIPSMRISTNKRTGEKVQLTSWKSSSDPSIGSFSGCLKPLNIPELITWNGTRPYWRSGPWNGRIFSGIPKMSSWYLDGFDLGEEDDGTVYVLLRTNDLKIIVFNTQGKIEERNWDLEKQEWKATSVVPETECDVYGLCGTFGSCNSQSSPICNCLRGFEPINPEEWNRKNWENGCKRLVPLHCEREHGGTGDGKGDDFLKLEMAKVPDFSVQSSVREDKCRNQCLENCSCTAYAYDVGIGCMSWSGDLIDIQQFSRGGIDLYIRVAHSELGKRRHVRVIIIVTVTIGIIILLAVSACFLWTWSAKHKEARKRNSKGKLNSREDLIGDLRQAKLQELPVYDFAKVTTATNDFHSDTKIGQGGFGPCLQDGQEVAIKRLSRASAQGREEFINEVVVISKLQHRNLVRLLGCCNEGDEKMLIYEYMANKSLEAILFYSSKQIVLDWKKRFNIIQGIAQGLLYLHRDSRLRIIHRDLKASNILLDEGLNPKISDFGMARIFGDSEDEANTRRIVGTYGYMSPEYAMDGLFSEKSDVFSFGVLLLEIVSGRRNTSFYHDKHSISLLGFACKLWNEDNITSLIDPDIYNICFQKDILRCIHIGLLCVQELAKDRPFMATVLSMLNSEIVHLPPPGQAGFIQRQIAISTDSPEEIHRICSINNVTVTNIQGR